MRGLASQGMAVLLHACLLTLSKCWTLQLSTAAAPARLHPAAAKQKAAADKAKKAHNKQALDGQVAEVTQRVQVGALLAGKKPF